MKLEGFIDLVVEGIVYTLKHLVTRDGQTIWDKYIVEHIVENDKKKERRKNFEKFV